MKISLNWLETFVDLIEKDHETIKNVITARSAEIETMEDTGNHLNLVVVGKIEKLLPHPNADKLTIAMVHNGKEAVQVVCGGSNLKEGMKVAFAQLGAVVKWHGTDVVKMEKAKIRDQESFGMICASEEIGLEEMFPKKSEKEIVDLSHISAAPGTPLADALGLKDVIIDIDNHAITNRADLFSQKGFAREFVACGLAKWKNNRSATGKQSDSNGLTIGQQLENNRTPLPIQIEIRDPEACSNYLAVYLTGVEVKDSQDWMKKHLSACGVRPISNLVDITNYVMLELGMPMHAFDLEQVKGKKWTMRKSKKGEKVITLDEKELELFEGITVFDDGHELFDLCGIMGGLHSGISAKTSKILLHAPVYNPALTRRAVRGLGQISDASTIYEKGVDNELALKGLNRAVELILELCPDAKIASGLFQIQNEKTEKRVLKLNKNRLEELVGLPIPEKETLRILNDLGFEVKTEKESYLVTVPSWRLNDVKMEADLVEEIARIHGYDNIPFTTPFASIRPVAINRTREREKEIKERLNTFGFNEIYTFAFLGKGLLEKSGMKVGGESLEITNPISSDMAFMRESLLPRTMEAVASNLRFSKAFKLFEISRVYRKKDNACKERTQLIMAEAGTDFRSLQGVTENMGFTLKQENSPDKHQHPGRCASLIMRGQKVGTIYQCHPTILKNFGIKALVTVAEIDLSAIHEMNIEMHPKFSELPKFPSIQLDVSILIPKKELAEQFFNAIKKTDKTLVKKIDLIDEYAGEKIEKDKRSLTYSITYRSDTATLTDEEVKGIHQKVLENLKTAGAVIRD